MENLFTPEGLIKLALMILATVPLLGGSAGGLVAAVVNLVKALLFVFKVVLPQEWAGRIVLLANGAVVVVLFVIYGPAFNGALPPDADTALKAITMILTGGATLLFALFSSGLVHNRMKATAPTLFSTTARKAAGLLPAKTVG